MKVVAVSQARMTSTRLPGKVMLDLAGAPLLQRHLTRLARARLVDEVIVAVPQGPVSDPIRELAKTLGLVCIDGPEHDVLERFRRAAQATAAECLVRVTSDCPFIDPDLVDLTITALQQQALDYATLDAPGSYPRGLDVEVFTRAALETAAEEAVDPSEREHVTAFFYRCPQRFEQARITGGPGAFARLCIDEQADLDLARQVFEDFGGRDDMTLEDLHRWALDNPQKVLINQSIEQKKS
jgi:spore coat polysaccharide biosynthesis protein SpsF